MMKAFNLFTEKIGAWLEKSVLHNHTNLSTNNKSINLKNNPKPPNKITKIKSPIVLTLSIISLTSITGYKYINQPKLDVGTTAPYNIYAPNDGSFEDTKTTEERRHLIRTGVVPTLRRDEEITQRTYQQIQDFLDLQETLRQYTGNFPFINPNLISLSTQSIIRQFNQDDWSEIINQINLGENNYQLNNKNQPEIINIIQEIKQYRQDVSSLEYNNLLSKIIISQTGYQQVQDILSRELDQNKKHSLIRFLEITDNDWEKVRRLILQASKKILTQGISPGMPSNLIEESIAVQLDHDLSITTKNYVINFLTNIFVDKPNLIEDKEETKRKAEKAAEAIPPVIIYINKGDLIINEDEIITQREFVLLDGFGLSKRSINWSGLLISASLVFITVGIFTFVVIKIHRPMRCRDHLLLYLLSLSGPILSAFNVPYSSLPAVALLVSSFYGPKLAITQTILLTGLMGYIGGTNQLQHLMGGFAGGLVAGLVAGRLHSREELAMLGGLIAVTQGGVYLTINLIFSAAAGTIWNVILPEATIYGTTGLAWVIAALGISPYLEKLFDVATPIRLAELSNPNRPLLKRLATETPGTFQHTLFVASLAEAAARELNCNVELVRAGTLYHDIGKMHDPMGFIENQMGQPNKHDQINDPWVSAEIIRKHVTEGLVMARKYNLPKVIRDFIPEHQGTILIAYFYYQAREILAQEDKQVDEADFRYDGPIPQSRETGIVMLADACEAALRSLNETTVEKALLMVKKIIKARWDEQQLVDSSLRKEELPIIAEVFVRVWQQHNHQRISYPKAVFEPK
jgi:putative nucleotidyltransferase with HDIG domain